MRKFFFFDILKINYIDHDYISIFLKVKIVTNLYGINFLILLYRFLFTQLIESLLHNKTFYYNPNLRMLMFLILDFQFSMLET